MMKINRKLTKVRKWVSQRSYKVFLTASNIMFYSTEKMHQVRLRHLNGPENTARATTQWLGVPGQGVGMREVRGSNPGESPIIAPPISRQIGLTRKSVRVIIKYNQIKITCGCF